MLLELGMPDDINVSIELKNWLFALEGTEEIREGWRHCNGEDFSREDRCWHTTFQNLQMKAKSARTNSSYGAGKLQKTGNHPLELIMVRKFWFLQSLKIFLSVAMLNNNQARVHNIITGYGSCWCRWNRLVKHSPYYKSIIISIPNNLEYLYKFLFFINSYSVVLFVQLILHRSFWATSINISYKLGYLISFLSTRWYWIHLYYLFTCSHD